jgi:hypothetical protein
VLHASDLLDDLLGPGAAARIAERPVEELLGRELFGADGSLRRLLLAGERREGWRTRQRVSALFLALSSSRRKSATNP